MEDVIEVDMNDTLANFASKKRRKKIQKKKVQEKVTAQEESIPDFPVDDQSVNDVSPGITVSLFDYSINNHFRALDTICSLSEEPKSDELEESEVEIISPSLTFLREWSFFNYPPRVLRFACQKENGTQMVDHLGEITLPQYSSATVPKNNGQDGSLIPLESRKDFVMYVGGLVWALDWCPRVHNSASQIKCEFIAVAAHPPESSYHKIGDKLIGRGFIQIWCLLNSVTNEEEDFQYKNQKKKPGYKPGTEAKSSEPKKPRGRPRKYPVANTESSEPKKPRGRPRKNPANILIENSNDNIQCVEALSVELPEKTSDLLLTDILSADSDKIVNRVSGRKNKGHQSRLSVDDFELTTPTKKRTLNDRAEVVSVSYGESLPSFSQNNNMPHLTFSNSEMEPVEPSASIFKSCTGKSIGSKPFIPKEVALPRVVLCLAHYGKVAWDVKWRPYNVEDASNKNRLGYLAVLLGDGALEVWEVPSPQTVKVIYSTRQKEGTDPRFFKLEPIFRCSKVKYGDRQSIPITLEWSRSAPHDLIAAGCHDGVVALWKFTTNRTSEDLRPLLCFSADTAPIRSLAWAPIESGPESANILVTAGHKGLKFWDLRDPFRTLWDFNHIQRNMYCLDWLPDPWCIIVSFDDGTLRILSLVKAANDAPVTGKPFVATLLHGFHSSYCSSDAIWSVQASLTGMVAYCGADGNVLRFQLTHKAVGNDPHRNRAPHFLCGSLSAEESAIIVTCSLLNTPFPMKKSLKEYGDKPRSMRGFNSVTNQAKRAKEKTEKRNMPEDETLALCYGEESGSGSDSEDLMEPRKRKETLKSKAKGKEKEVCDKGENIEEIEKLPPKLVSMHRVRWNMNKGSERWLCSGGAAGIVRVQMI